MIKPLNNNSDVALYLKSDKATKPFLSEKKLKEKLNKIKEKRESENKDTDTIECLVDFVFNELKLSTDKDFLSKQKFNRTAKEIYESGFFTGCTDKALLFATFAKQLGISTTVLHTVQKEWANKFINNLGDTKMHYGHTFCECFVNDKWILIDPTFGKIMWKYKQGAVITLPEYKVSNSCTYLPYTRNLDLSLINTQKQFIENEDIMVKALYSNFLGTKNVVKRYYEAKTPEDLLLFMNEILTYGFLDADGVEHIATMKEIEKHRTLSIEEIFDYKYETCCEAAKLAKHWFLSNDMDCKLFFSRVKAVDNETGNVNYPDLHFLILFKDKEKGWCRFEQSSAKNRGLYVFNDYENAINFLKKAVEDEKTSLSNLEKYQNSKISGELYYFDDVPDSYKEVFDKAFNKENLMNKGKSVIAPVA